MTGPITGTDALLTMSFRGGDRKDKKPGGKIGPEPRSNKDLGMCLKEREETVVSVNKSLTAANPPSEAREVVKGDVQKADGAVVPVHLWTVDTGVSPEVSEIPRGTSQAPPACFGPHNL